MKYIGAGESAEVYKIGNNKVIKLFYKDNFDEESFNEEYNMCKYLGDNTSFAPSIYGKIKIKDRVAYEMEEVIGELFIDVIDEEINKFESNANLLGNSHRILHEQSVEKLSELPRCKDFLKKGLLRLDLFNSRWRVHKSW